MPAAWITSSPTRVNAAGSVIRVVAGEWADANASPIGRSHQLMADTAAHQVDRVFPRVPVRQWVLSFPHDLRYRLAYDASLVTDILGIFTKTIFASLFQRAREFGAERKAQTGAVSFIQRFS
jgi:hypothetical protein